MRRSWLFLLCTAALTGGCGGQYILTVPDQLAPAGGEATTVVRLQRNDFFVLAPATKDALMQFRIAGGPLRAAYTDKFGYAGTTVPVPAEPGRYRLVVSHLDIYGDEVTAERPAYVWKADRPAIAVDMDCLPGLWLGDAKSAAVALRRLADGANVLYLTRRSTRRHPGAHKRLRNAGYPDGPILLWRRERWHIVREKWRGVPIVRVVVESRLVGQLPEVRKTFPGLTVGICNSQLAASAFSAAGLRCVVVGAPSVKAKTQLTHRKSWAQLGTDGL